MPLIPCISVIINIYLMMQLDVYTWVRFIVWLIIGKVMYKNINSRCDYGVSVQVLQYTSCMVSKIARKG